MSLCFRTIPNKLTPFVCTKKRITKINRQLPKHVKTSRFLEKFLGTQATVVAVTNLRDKIYEISVIPKLHQNVCINSTTTVDSLAETSIKRCNTKCDQSDWLAQTDPLMLTYPLMSKNWNDILVNHNNFNQSLVYDSIIYDNNALFISKRLDDIDTEQTFKKQILLTNGLPNAQDQSRNPVGDKKDRPSEQQLQLIFDVLSTDLPCLFHSGLNYSIYERDVTFVNNIKGTVTQGLVPYMLMLSTLKILAHFRFSYVKLDIMRMTLHPEDDTIKVHWRIRAVSGMKVLFLFWKVKLWESKEQRQEQESWYDGLSTFYVNGHGLIFKHVVDKVLPDQEVCEKPRTAIPVKLALFSTLAGLNTLNCNRCLLK